MRSFRLLLHATLTAAVAGCGSAGPTASDLAGSYELVIGPAQAVRNPGARSALVLETSGVFTQTCEKESGRRQALRGRWELREGNVLLSMLLDCAGLWKKGRPQAASLLLDATPPIALRLSPDLDARYERTPGS